MNKEKTDIQKKTPLSSGVMEEIHSSHIQMRPRMYFVLATVFLVVGIVFSVLVASFFAGVLLMRLRTFGVIGFLGFGSPGISPFLRLFPWESLFIALSSLSFGYILLRKTDVVYTYNYSLVLLILSACVLVLGYSADIFRIAELHERVPIIREMYPPLNQRRGDSWIVGTICEVSQESIVVELPGGEFVRILWDQETVFLSDESFLGGQQVRAVGYYIDEGFLARIIEIFTRTRRFPKSMRPSMIVPPLPF